MVLCGDVWVCLCALFTIEKSKEFANSYFLFILLLISSTHPDERAVPIALTLTCKRNGFGCQSQWVWCTKSMTFRPPCVAHSTPVCDKVKWNMVFITFFIQISCEKRTKRACGRNGWTGNVSERWVLAHSCPSVANECSYSSSGSWNSLMPLLPLMRM